MARVSELIPLAYANGNKEFGESTRMSKAFLSPLEEVKDKTRDGRTPPAGLAKLVQCQGVCGRPSVYNLGKVRNVRELGERRDASPRLLAPSPSLDESSP
ncbi:hypothetical protein V1477_004629 [Vespula maculifrons]|uniref:Uncharacterized protein n=2 Tax=Vespula TaxID=7451 RepID=A0A834KK33_VESVU|nr:hypothetical protein HZH66_002514 [Vespula vulgaris]